MRSWRGIPYASRPEGAHRYLPALPPAPWSGVRDATRFGPICAQPPLAGLPPAEVAGNECLVLNVWAPPREVGGGLPVLVWIHGGGFTVGSGSAPALSGRLLSHAASAVVVTINYRLGPWGFLDLSALPGSQGRFVTNLGLRDQIAALKWVQENIGAFGGDPTRVTLGGQSAGAGSVCCLLASPKAQGLFTAAIAQSPPAASVFDAARSERIARVYADELGFREPSFEDILQADEARMVDAAGKILESVTSVFPGHHAFQPVIDNDVLLDMPARAIAAGAGSAVPLLIGSNEDEGSLFTTPPMPPLIPTSPQAVGTFLAQEHAAVADRVHEAYASHGRFGSLTSIGGHGMISMPTAALAQEHSKHAPTYLYRFDWTNEDLMGKRLGTPHTLDVPFVFGTLQDTRITNLDLPAGSADAVSASMQEAWFAFLRDRVPASSGVAWPRYSADSRDVALVGNAGPGFRTAFEAALMGSWGI